ncbi:hypothetical protein DNTS_022250 [Danionella cerebrum]|uniref:Leptin n=1 Tax=Danionella cerebrum TaxID=2873325 RepID=A0A553QEK2_9TELE|nr:hypothetical protein DNTS_022250 [Danionella translucida]
MYLPALLCTCLLSMLSVVYCLPIHHDSLKVLIKMQAETIIHKIKVHVVKFNLPQNATWDLELYEPISAAKPIQGLGSIIDTLSTFQIILQGFSKGHQSQLQRELSSLEVHMKERAAWMGCKLKKPTRQPLLDALLKHHEMYPVTATCAILDRLKQFMQKLIANLDQLKSC